MKNLLIKNILIVFILFYLSPILVACDREDCLCNNYSIVTHERVLKEDRGEFVEKFNVFNYKKAYENCFNSSTKMCENKYNFGYTFFTPLEENEFISFYNGKKLPSNIEKKSHRFCLSSITANSGLIYSSNICDSDKILKYFSDGRNIEINDPELLNIKNKFISDHEKKNFIVGILNFAYNKKMGKLLIQNKKWINHGFDDK